MHDFSPQCPGLIPEFSKIRRYSLTRIMLYSAESAMPLIENGSTHRLPNFYCLEECDMATPDPARAIPVKELIERYNRELMET